MMLIIKWFPVISLFLRITSVKNHGECFLNLLQEVLNETGVTKKLIKSKKGD